MLFYQFLDWFFVIFHSGLIIFNIFGWIYKPTRKWNFLALCLTAASWFILGLFYGIGYCFLTDWHWQVLRKLSEYPFETSYVQYLFRRIFSIRVSAEFADTLTATVFFAVFFVSGIINLRDIIKKNKIKKLYN